MDQKPTLSRSERESILQMAHSLSMIACLGLDNYAEVKIEPLMIAPLFLTLCAGVEALET